MRVLPTILVSMILCGCASKAKKQTQAQAAYRAGQQRAYEQIMEARRINIRVIGPVQHPEVEWHDGLSRNHAVGGWF